MVTRPPGLGEAAFMLVLVFVLLLLAGYVALHVSTQVLDAVLSLSPYRR